MQEESKNQEVALDESALSHSQISGGSEENKKKKRKRLGKYVTLYIEFLMNSFDLKYLSNIIFFL
jgi:hypothetical protein